MTYIDRIEPQKIFFTGSRRNTDLDVWISRACRSEHTDVPTKVLLHDFNSCILIGNVEEKVREILEKKQRTIAIIRAFDSGREVAEWLLLNGVKYENLKWCNIKNDEVFSLRASKIEVIDSSKTYFYRKSASETDDIARTDLFISSVRGVKSDLGAQKPLPRGFKTSTCDLCVTWEF